MKKQIELQGRESYSEIQNILAKSGAMKVFVACGRSFQQLEVRKYLEALSIPIVYFNDFEPNPQYDSVVRGIRLFQNEHCDFVMGIGGGSAIDTAKCIKLYAYADANHNLLEQDVAANDIPLLAMPTTAGSGSEATRFAVIYYLGEKQSITRDDILPDYVILDPNPLRTLPLYQKKSTMADALCHSIESFWSIHSTEESRQYSKRAIQMILENMDIYVDDKNVADSTQSPSDNDTVNKNMLLASNIAGKAINIAQTTAGHAMSYKITSTLGIPHGHAVAACLASIWMYMIQNVDRVTDKRGGAYLRDIFDQLAGLFDCDTHMDAVRKFDAILKKLELFPIQTNGKVDIETLVNSVNPVRLKNNPVELDNDTIRTLYLQIFNTRSFLRKEGCCESCYETFGGQPQP